MFWKQGRSRVSIVLVTFLLASLFPVPAVLASTPGLTIVSPLSGSVVYSSSVTITGYVSDTASSGLRINGITVPFDAQGQFSWQVNLISGDNTITCTAVSPTGHSTTKTVNVYYNSTAPQVEVTSHSNNEILTNPNVTISGRIVNRTGQTALTLNGSSVTINNDDTFAHAIVLNQGLNTVYLRVTENGIPVSEKYLYLTYNQVSLLENLEVDSRPATDFMFVNSGTVTVTGSIQAMATATINGVPISGSFSQSVPLTPGENKIIVDVNNGELVRSFRVLYDNGQPFLYNLSPEKGSNVYSSPVTVTGSVYEADTLKINGQSVSINSANTFSASVSVSSGITVELVKNGVATPAAYSLNYVSGPEITINTPVNGFETGENSVSVEGTVNVNTVSLKVKNNTGINPREFSVAIPDKKFSTLVNLKPGLNSVVFTAANSAGATVTKTLNVTYKGTPVINVTSPAVGETVYTNSIVIGGKVYNTINGGLKLDDKIINFDPNGNFATTVNLQTGSNSFNLTATDGNTIVKKVVTLNYDSRPLIYIAEPTSGLATPQTTITLKGTAVNTDKWGFTVNDSVVPLGTDGAFVTSVSLKKKINNIVLRASKNGITTTKTIVVNYTGDPSLTIKAPLDKSTVTTNTIEIKGSVYPTDGLASFQIECADTTYNTVYNSSTGDFSQVIKLKVGDNTITITADDGVSEPLEQKLIVTYDNSPGINLYSVFDGMTVFSNKLRISGTVLRTEGGGLKVNNETVAFGSDGSFSKTLTLEVGSNTVTVSAAKGQKTTTKKYIVFYNDIAKTGAEVELIAKKGEETNAFGEFLKLKPAEQDYLENNLHMRIIDPDDIEAAPGSSALVGPITEIDFDRNPLKPFTLTLQYDKVINDYQSKKISVFYFDEDDDKWRIMGGQVNTEDKTIAIKTDKEGKYVVAIYYKTFNDVLYHWGRNDIEYLIAQGIANGVTNSSFKPDGIITRAEFATLLAKACGLTPVTPVSQSFSDVGEGHWAYSYVEAAVRAGYISGVSAHSFAPARQITREQAAVMLARAGSVERLEDAKVKAVLDSFIDGKKVSNYAGAEVASSVEAGLLKGLGEYRFKPQGTTTRAQAASMIVRLMEYLQESEE